MRTSFRSLLTRLIIVLMLLPGTATVSHAQEVNLVTSSETYTVANHMGCSTCNDCKSLNIRFTPYGWLTQQHGDLTIRDRTADVSVNFGKTWDLIWNDLNFMFLGQLEGNYGRAGFIINGIYSDFSPGTEVARLNFNGNMRQTILDTVLTYELDILPHWLGACSGARLEALAGVRYNCLTANVTLTRADGATATGSGHQDWFDPIIGGRYRLPLGDCLAFQARADVGGFNWGEASQFTWNIELTAEYKWSDRLSLMAGYRWLDIDRESGQGSMRFGYDINLNGPIMGLIFSF